MTSLAAEPEAEEEVADPAPARPGITKRPEQKRGGFWGVVRSILFWSHLVMGTIGGVIIFIMSVTGAILGFERQLIARFDGVAKAAPPSPTADRLPLDSMFQKNGIDIADVASVVLKSDRTEPVSVRFRERDKAAQLVDPFTAAPIAPAPRGKTAAFMSWLRGWHRWLGVTGEGRTLARKVTGAANIAFLLLVFTGLYIWWPKRLSKAAFTTAAVFYPRLGGKARDFNWHNSLGFWSAIPLALVIATGAFISYSWPGQWMDRLWGTEKERAAAIKAMNTPSAPPGAQQTNAPSAQGGNAAGQRSETRANAPRVLASLDAMVTSVETKQPEWSSITVTTAAPRDSVVQLAVAEGNTYRPDLKTQYFFDATSGALVRTTNFDSLSTSRKIRGWTRFGHTGEVFGVAGQSIATFVSIVGAILVYTGLALAWRRMVAFIKRRNRTLAAG